jgi:hypothetical protein
VVEEAKGANANDYDRAAHQDSRIMVANRWSATIAVNLCWHIRCSSSSP